MASSRLGYLSDRGPGGRKPGANRSGASSHRNPPSPASNGVPGPEARRIDIGEVIRTVGMRYQHTFAVVPDPELDGPELASGVPTTGNFVLSNTGAALLLRGKGEGSLQLTCSRCLVDFTQSVDFELAEEFDLVTENGPYQQEEVRAVDANDTAPVVEGTILDVGELLRQSLWLAAPLQPLCSPDCPGLGGEPAEPATDVHRPLAALADLLRDQEDPSDV